MAKNTDLSTLDNNQMARQMFSVENEAMRVEIVAGADLKIEVDPSSLTDAIKEGLSNLKLDNQKNVTPTIQIEQIPVQTIVKEIEYRELQIPVVIKETVIQTIDRPVMIEHIKTIEIEKPILVTEYKDLVIQFPKHLQILLVLQTLTILGLMIGLFFRR